MRLPVMSRPLRTAIGTTLLFTALTGTTYLSAPTAPSQALTTYQVSPDDPVMGCAGPDAPPGWCSIEKFVPISKTVIDLPSEKVTDYVAGCTTGSQPSVAKSITFTKAFTISASLGLSYKIPGSGDILKESGPGAAVGVSWQTSFGEGHTYTVPADYGMISWGAFSQQVVEVVADMTVRVEEPAADVPNAVLYAARGVTVNLPLEDRSSRLPYGTLSKMQRPFYDEAEFTRICGHSRT